MKLSIKLLIAFIILLVLFVNIVGGTVYLLTSQFLQDSVTENNTEAAKNTMDKIDRFLNERIIDIEFISDLSKIRESLVSDNQDKVNLAEKKLEEIMNRNGVWWDISVLDPKGTQIASTDVLQRGQQYQLANETEDLFNAALEGEITYTDVLKLNSNGRLTISLFAPVWSLDESPHVIGIVNAHLAWPTVIDILNELQTAEARLVNKDGLLIASNFAAEREQLYKLSLTNTEVFKAVSKKSKGTIIAKDLDQNQNALITYANQKGYDAYQGKGWTLIFEIPLSTAYAPARSASLIIVGVFSLVTFIIGVVALFAVIRGIVKPIELLNQSAKNIAKGNFHQQVPVKSKDEIGELANSFNQMSNKIQSAYEHLEEQVKVKTAELNQKVEELEKVNSMMVDRELKMIELKEKNKELENQLNNQNA